MAKGELNLSSLSAKERRQVQQDAEVVHALAMKALLSRLDAKALPASNGSSAEAKAALIVKAIKPKPFGKLVPLIESKKDQAAEFSRIASSARWLNPGADTQADNEIEFPAGSLPVSAQSRLNLIVRALHCVDETDPHSGTDDMILGGVLVGASGRTNIAHTIIQGGFDSGVRKEFLSPQRDFGTYNLNSTSTYPKDFWAIFKLLESDSDNADVAMGLEMILRLYSQLAEAQHQSAPLNVRSYRVASTTLASLKEHYGVPDFQPRGIVVTLSSPNDVAGTNLKLSTSNIKGLGGKYRIGYTWRLS